MAAATTRPTPAPGDPRRAPGQRPGAAGALRRAAIPRSLSTTASQAMEPRRRRRGPAHQPRLRRAARPVREVVAGPRGAALARPGRNRAQRGQVRGHRPADEPACAGARPTARRCCSACLSSASAPGAGRVSAWTQLRGSLATSAQLRARVRPAGDRHRIAHVDRGNLRGRRQADEAVHYRRGSALAGLFVVLLAAEFVQRGTDRVRGAMTEHNKIPVP